MSERDRIGAALAAATCALLGTGTANPVQAQEVKRWTLDSALLYYGEDGRRVKDVSASVNAKRDFDDDRFLSFDLSVDTLTGASPSGALATGGPQTFTRPSGNAIYTTSPAEIPLDDTFKDTRIAVGVSWMQPWARLYTVATGFSASDEYDYLHLGLNGSIARDFNDRNTTLSAGVAYSADHIDPVGGTPVALSSMGDVGNLGNRGGTESKDTLDLLIGFTQVLSRTMLMRVNYSYSNSSGYLTDPYKVLSVVDPLTGSTLARTPSGLGPDGQYRFESRPDSRVKQALFGEIKKDFGGKVLDVSARLMTDDWGIDSETLESRLRWPVGGNSYLEPHVRYYMQDAADFYRTSLVAGQPLPRYASADFRLGEFDGLTVGLKYGQTTASGNEWSARVEYYQQRGKLESAGLFGTQRAYEQLPELDAVIAQFSYRFSL